ncbi:MAG: hypothetical protein JRJ37_10905 [Deltaproteobacteria bacterium]|nr:hypothetical protein [Deltaproteobacteria bacterium]
MLRFFKYLFFFILFLAVLVTAGAVGVMYHLVVKAPSPEMDEAYIESILGRESPVYYRRKILSQPSWQQRTSIFSAITA